MKLTDNSPPVLRWTENGEECSARWRSESAVPPAKRVVIADDRTTADAAYRLACEGTALLWRGDFQNARQLLQAMARRLDRKPRKASASQADAFNLHRQAQSQRARTLGMLLLPFDDEYRIPLRRAPDVQQACAEAYGPPDDSNKAPFVASLREAGVEPSGMTVAVLGAGGAARSVIDALARVGVDQIVVINRSAARAEAAAQLGAGRGRVGDVADIAHVDLVVNATSVGMGSDEAPFDLALLRSTQVVADLVYHPIETALLRAARRCGATAVDGLGMLVHQAVLQQQLWTGVSPDPAAMRAAAEHELVARHG